ncbi:unnamed protein product, partial [Staurois parvus]
MSCQSAPGCLISFIAALGTTPLFPQHLASRTIQN